MVRNRYNNNMGKQSGQRKVRLQYNAYAKGDFLQSRPIILM